MNTEVISKEKLLKNWQGHRNLTRRVIEKFPENELFNLRIGGMRPFSDIVKELLAIAVPGLEGIVYGKQDRFDHKLQLDSKELLLKAWDDATPKIDQLFMQIPVERFKEPFNLFGQFDFPVVDNILYFIDNEIHHRGQGYVYLRSLGIEPPFFWERN